MKKGGYFLKFRQVSYIFVENFYYGNRQKHVIQYNNITTWLASTYFQLRFWKYFIKKNFQIDKHYIQ